MHTRSVYPSFSPQSLSRCNVSCFSQHSIASQPSSSDILNSLSSTFAFTRRGFLGKRIQFACDTFTQMVSILQHAASRCSVCLFSHTRLPLFLFNRLSSRSATWGFLQTHSLMIQTVGFNPDFSLAQLCRHVSQRVAYLLLGF